MPSPEEELDRFAESVRKRLADAAPNRSLDQLFGLWRSENSSDSWYAENVAAIHAALDDFRNGDRGTLAGEHSDQLRREFR